MTINDALVTQSESNVEKMHVPIDLRCAMIASVINTDSIVPKKIAAIVKMYFGAAGKFDSDEQELKSLMLHKVPV